MAISKTTRFQVLRRDKSTCRYCGRVATESEMHVDHVTPVSLGGSDNPDNLVTACVDCNQGKGASAPDAELVADVAQDAQRWAKAIDMAASSIFGRSDAVTSACEAFQEAWSFDTAWHGGEHKKPDTWRETIANYVRSGLPEQQIVYAAQVSLNARGVVSSDRFRYFCGVCNRLLRDLTEAAQGLIEKGDA